jgi:hypothetical protein
MAFMILLIRVLFSGASFWSAGIPGRLVNCSSRCSSIGVLVPFGDESIVITDYI